MKKSKESNPARPAQQLVLRRGLSLLAARDGSYQIGNSKALVPITTAFARSALQALAVGRDPRSAIAPSELQGIENLIGELWRADLITEGREEIALPERYLNEVIERDLAAQQLRRRCAPELLQCEWSRRGGDGRDLGATLLVARGSADILISGRNRISTLLYSLLLESGVSLVDWIDRFDTPGISDLDIGVSTITGANLALNFYQHLQSQKRSISLFPLKRAGAPAPVSKRPLLIIHAGALDIEDMVDWMGRGQAHLLIHPALGDEVTISPIVIPGKTPCLRCADLNQLDQQGYSTLNRIPLTEVDGLSMVAAHFIAALVAAQVLHFIDAKTSSTSALAPDTGVAQSITIDIQKLSQPRALSITRHPLCGCDNF
jgi:hypothetical protein